MRDYNQFLSKVKRVIIPLPDFNFFHRASQDGDVDDKFVGRNNISALLENWLRVPYDRTKHMKNSTADCTGSYLITGYRGMGKTSFVGKVINKLEKEQETIWNKRSCSPFRKFWLAVICMSPLLVVPGCALISSGSFCNTPLIWISIPCFIYLLIISILLFVIAPNVRRKSRSILKVKINIGNEVADIKDIFSLLAYSVKDRLNAFIEESYVKSPTSIAFRMLKYLFISVSSVFLFVYAIDVLSSGTEAFYSAKTDSLLFYIIQYVNDVGLEVRGHYRYLAYAAGGITVYLISRFIWLCVKKAVNILTKYWNNRRYQLPEIYKSEAQQLCDRIDTNLSEEHSPYGELTFASYLSVMLRMKKIRQYQRASVREIEYELIELINKINKNRLLNCRFIFIFDELDKLSSSKENDSQDSSGSSADLPGFTNDDNGMSDEMTANEKRHNTLKLLSQLKYFVSTAEAKFVFIAGHELYDAYKADVSDREFSISSIFNGVINVSSFFSYDSRIKDVTRMTETYLCKILFGNEQVTIDNSKDERDCFRLGQYRKRIGTSCVDETQEEKEVESVMCLLKQFVTYLTFVSNGAPKKLSARLERYIISSDKFNKEHDPNDSIIVKLKGGHNNVKYYLSLGYHDRQKVGFVHHMAAPIFDNMISPSSDYGDKFLVSSSFLIAHIYKHHKSGFSWRNLEYLPELMDTNRTPELREFINSIIDYLGKVHLTNITSGIFTYKFPMKLAEEIAIFTKKSDELSAIFNFSLDYFASVKKYYYRLIQFYNKEGGADSIVSSLHHNLGDIHMANDEYSEAIVQYRHAVECIEKDLDKVSRTNDVDLSGNYASHIIRYARMMLKLGLAYEKRNTIDSAHMIYTRLCSRLISYRDIDERELGLTHYFELKPNDRNAANNWQRKVAVLTKIDQQDYMYQHDNFGRRCYPEVIEPNKSNSFEFWMYGDQLVNNLSDFLTPCKHALITKLSVFEDLRIAYLPILAKLLALEKHNICGITKDNIKIAEAEFQHMYIITNSVDKYLLRVDFFRKLGDIMYYKNRAFKGKNLHSFMYAMECWGYDLRGSIFNYCYRRKQQKAYTEALINAFNEDIDFSHINSKSDVISAISNNKKIHVLKDDVSRIVSEIPDEMLDRISDMKDCDCRRGELKCCPCYACKYYKRSLIYLKGNLLNLGNDIADELNLSDSIYFWYALDDGYLLSYRFNELIQAALSLESMGNVMLSCGAIKNCNVENSLNTCLLEALFDNHDDVSGFIKAIKGRVRKMTNIDKAILYYWSAMQYYSKAGNYKESMQALTKIFNTISSYDATVKKNNAPTLKFINLTSFFASMEKVVKDTISNIAQLRMFDNALEEQRLKRIRATNGPLNLGLISILPEIEELLLSYYELKLSQMSDDDEDLLPLVGMFYRSPSLTYLRNDSMIYNRVISLMFKARLNERVLSLAGLEFKCPGRHMDSERHAMVVRELFAESVAVTEEQTLAFLISDSIFCLINIADILRSNVKTTIFSDSFCYGAYKRLYHWIRWKDYVEKHRKGVNSIMSKHSAWLYEGHHHLMLTETYMSGMARKHFEAAVSMHSEGYEYQNFIRNMYIMDDDLQNNTCQFYFALERMKLNSGYFRDVEDNDPCNDCYNPDNYYKS